ncbi:YfiR family protein [Desertivirga xinjiangensis]|uniref:YfiR family protein n=1 Tax=Desertivirga xinjiangensis TaxID=539206 RepID=UPI00210CB701|nr:YfiR family protein [Pedobacter xinjiangensis]
MQANEQPTISALKRKVSREYLLSIFLHSKSFLLLLLIFFFSEPVCIGQSKIAKVYQLEAAFLYNFTRFVNWTSANPSGETQFVIGIVGRDPFEGYIDEIVKGERVDGRSIVIRRYDDVSNIGNCSILFIGFSEAEKIRQALKKVKKRGTLTVADSPNFVKRGGAVEFFIEENKVRLKINVDAAKAEGLEISSKLLNLAKIY